MQRKTPSRSLGSPRTGRKPGSVFGGHLSGTGVAAGLKRPIPGVMAGRASPSPLLGLAPGGVCRAAPVSRKRGGLLPHRFTLARTGPGVRPLAVSSLWHFPSGYPAQALPGTPPYGARTFLTQGGWPSGATAPPSRGTPILPQAKALRKSLTLQDRNPPERPPGEGKTLCTGGRKPGLKGPKRRGGGRG